MKNFSSLLLKELKLYLWSPTAYVFSSAFLLIIGFLTFTVGNFFELGEASLANSFFKWHPLLLATFCSAIGSRSWSEEYRQGTLDLLFSLPVSITGLVLSKFLACFCFVLIPLIATFPFVITVFSLGEPDVGMLITGYCGSLLLSAAFCAISCFASTLSRSQTISFVVSLFICLTLVLISVSSFTLEIVRSFPGSTVVVDAISQLGINQHHMPFRLGKIDLTASVYFISLTVLFIIFNQFRIEKSK